MLILVFWKYILPVFNVPEDSFLYNLLILLCSFVIVLVQATVNNTLDWMAYQQQKFISHSSGSWEF